MAISVALSPRLLLVDDDEAACRLLSEVLERETTRSSGPSPLLKDSRSWDAKAPSTRYSPTCGCPGRAGSISCRGAERDPNAIVIVLTAFGDAGTAGEAIRAGAHDFISKPYDIGRGCGWYSCARRAETDPVSRSDEPSNGSDGRREQEPELVGHSPAIIGVMKTVARVAPSQASVLVSGETGTGKELVARTVHRYSERSRAKFVAVNCSALAEGLLESELFGHVRGAFTGAQAARPGLFREADHGTLFLDEIGDISPALQSRLLRVLQEQEIVPVGSETPVRVDVRVIAATHRDLPVLVREGRFREDLYYRLNVVTITLAPLRERRQDIPLLIDDLLRRLAARHERGPVAVDPEAQRALLMYDWPGNVRELLNVLERALVLAAQDVIRPEHLSEEVRAALLPHSAPIIAQGPNAPATEMIPLAAVEKRHVLAVLAASDGNRERAARVLQISRRTLSRMLQRWGMSTPRS